MAAEAARGVLAAIAAVELAHMVTAATVQANLLEKRENCIDAS
jgi:hypothetical protein